VRKLWWCSINESGFSFRISFRFTWKIKWPFSNKQQSLVNKESDVIYILSELFH